MVGNLVHRGAVLRVLYVGGSVRAVSVGGRGLFWGEELHVELQRDVHVKRSRVHRGGGYRGAAVRTLRKLVRRVLWKRRIGSLFRADGARDSQPATAPKRRLTWRLPPACPPPQPVCPQAPFF